jgi:hypothetical protein
MCQKKNRQIDEGSDPVSEYKPLEETSNENVEIIKMHQEPQECNASTNVSANNIT